MSLVQVPARIYIGMGTQEAGKEMINEKLVSVVHLLAENLASASIPPVVQLNIGTGDSHNESAWSRRLPQALIFLFGTAKGNVKPSIPTQH